MLLLQRRQLLERRDDHRLKMLQTLLGIQPFQKTNRVFRFVVESDDVSPQDIAK